MILDNHERTYSAPDEFERYDLSDAEMNGSTAFESGRDDRRENNDENPFVTGLSRYAWQRGWEYEDRIIKENSQADRPQGSV